MDTLKIIERNYQNLNLFVRDLKLSDKIYQMYKKNIIVTDPSFIDMTYFLGGMNKNLNTRFIIMSNRASDMQELEEDTKWGLFVIHTKAYFKVLDTFNIENKHFIVLLHIYKDDLEFFEENEVSLDEKIVLKTKNLMNTLITKEVISTIDNNTWYKRVNFPIGIDDDEKFFPIK